MEAHTNGPAPMPIAYGTVSNGVDGGATARGVVPCQYVGKLGDVFRAADHMDDFAIDPMAPDAAKLTVEQAAIAFELWQINRHNPQ